MTYSDYSNTVSDQTYYAFTLTSMGTGVSTLRFRTDTEQIVKLIGGGKFYTDAAGTLGESTEWTLTAGALRTIYLKVTSGTSKLCVKISNITSWGDQYYQGYLAPTGGASIAGDVSKFTNLVRLWVSGSNTITGSVAALTNLTGINVSGTNTISGSISALTSLVYLNVTGNNSLSGSITSLTNLDYLSVTGVNTITGSLNNLTALTYVYMYGLNTISGDIGVNGVTNGLTGFTLSPCRISEYTSGATWTNATVSITPSYGYGLSSAEVDNMLIDMADSAGGPSGKVITLKGWSEGRTAASDDAVATLQGRSCTVNTNVYKVLALGNSLTIHPIVADLWWGYWGMAAAHEAEDYVHLLQTEIRAYSANVDDAIVYPVSITGWETTTSGYNYQPLDIYFVDRLQIVLVRIGENVDETNFETRLQALIDYVLSKAPSVQIIFTGCFWPDESKDLSISTVCSANSLPYDELATLYTADNRVDLGDTVYDAGGNPHTVVAAVVDHPNNAGMAAIEGKIYDLIEPYLV